MWGWFMFLNMLHMAVFEECSSAGEAQGEYQVPPSFFMLGSILFASIWFWVRSMRGWWWGEGNLLLVCCSYYSLLATSRPQGQKVSGMECVHGWWKLRRETHTVPSFFTLESTTGKWWWMCLLRWVHVLRSSPGRTRNTQGMSGIGEEEYRQTDTESFVEEVALFFFFLG